MNKDIDFTDFNILFYNVDKSPDTLYFENAIYPIEGEEFEETNKEEDFEIKWKPLSKRFLISMSCLIASFLIIFFLRAAQYINVQ